MLRGIIPTYAPVRSRRPTGWRASRFSSALASWFKAKNRKNPDTRPVQIHPPPPVLPYLCILDSHHTRVYGCAVRRVGF
jgi:hypothetical protein